MALGSTVKRRVTYYLTMKSQNKEKQTDPHFEMARRNADGTTDKNLPKEVEVSGKLIKLGHREFEFEPSGGGGKRKGKSVIVVLIDNGEEFKIEANINTGIGRDLMNKIISTDKIGTLMLRLYKNKEDMANLYIENDGERMGWKYQYKEDLKPLVELMPDPQNPEGDKIKVYAKVNNKLLEDWIKQESIINKANVVTADDLHDDGLEKEFEAMPDPSIARPEDGPPPPSEDDLPF